MTEHNKLPTLYKRKGKNKITQWNISTEDNVIITVFGEQGGKFQEYRETIFEGKNIGRSNETTSIEQAQLEAKSSWNYKKDREGYRDDVTQIDNKREAPVAMLAHSYDKHFEKINFPAYSQPKLDGHRCLAETINGVCTLYSRTGKITTGVPHINRYLEKYFDNTILDGELYNEDYADKFEQLSSFIRQETPIDGYEIVHFHVYDVIHLPIDTVYADRLRYLTNMFALVNDDTSPIKIVETIEVDQDNVANEFRKARLAGYEGIMLRNRTGLYVGKRSYDLQKVKEFDDAEFEVVGIESGKGKLAGHAILVLSLSNGETFMTKMKGSFENLKYMFENPSEFIGRQVTVQYQGLTTYGVPRFPVAIRFRDEE